METKCNFMTHQDVQVLPYLGLQVMTPTVLSKNVYPAVYGGDIGRTDSALWQGPICLPITLLLLLLPLLEIAYRRIHFKNRREWKKIAQELGGRERERE